MGTKKVVKKSKPAAAKKAVKPAPASAAKKSSPSKAKDSFLKEVTRLIQPVEDKDLAALLKNFTTTVGNLKVLSSFEKNKEIRSAHNQRIDQMYADKTVIEVTEGRDDNYFILKINGQVKSFTLEEMRKLVKISHAASSPTECAAMFFNWFSKFRFDFLNDLNITSKNTKIFPDLQQFLKSKYQTKS